MDYNTEAGKKFYAQRKSTVEPVFGIIKEVMGFRRFMLRGLDTAQGEWVLVYGFQSKASLCLTFCGRGNNAQKSVISLDLYDFCVYVLNEIIEHTERASGR